jgi:hypothetical protein
MTVNNNKLTDNLFEVKDCAIITRMGGVESAINLRELKERLITCSIDCLYYHFCETLIRPAFDNPEYRNDFALWAAYNLRDRVLAERLGIINPYSFNNLEELRERIIEIVEDRLSCLEYIPSVPKGDEFIFMRAATVVFDTGLVLKKPSDLLLHLPKMSKSTLYYHFMEARRRTQDRVDDFTFWLQFHPDKNQRIIDVLSQIDFYFINLNELKSVLIKTLKNVVNKS